MRLGGGSTPENVKLDNDEEMTLDGSNNRDLPSSEASSTPMGMRIVVSLPEMTSPGDSSAEEVCLLPVV